MNETQREQTRRDAQVRAEKWDAKTLLVTVIEQSSSSLRVEARIKLDALFAELEQAGRERDEAAEEADQLDNRLDAANFRLAKVPALLEALGEAAVALEALRAEDARKPYREHSPEMRTQIITATDSMRDALTVWEGGA